MDQLATLARDAVRNLDTMEALSLVLCLSMLIAWLIEPADPEVDDRENRRRR